MEEIDLGGPKSKVKKLSVKHIPARQIYIHCSVRDVNLMSTWQFNAFALLGHVMFKADFPPFANINKSVVSLAGFDWECGI